MKKIIYYLNSFWLILLLNAFIIPSLVSQPACLGEQGQLRWQLWENQPGGDLVDFTHLHTFPNHPNAYEWIKTIQSPGVEYQRIIESDTFLGVNYGIQYGSLIRGFLSVSETGNYSFNLTGDDQSSFYLSLNETKDQLVLRASVSNWTYREEYEKAEESNQTSIVINLQQGQFYYFEVLHKEHSGGDHVEVKWKTPSNTSEWQALPSENVYDYMCPADCPAPGTPCDDGDLSTDDDQEDGFCNCIGTPVNKPVCVGQRRQINAFYYLEIEGGSLNDLRNADKYPLAPDTVEQLQKTEGPLINRDNYGTRISGLLKVPVTGSYQFAITAADQAAFDLSTTASRDQATEIAFTGWSSAYEMYHHESQTSGTVTLEKENYYYFELNHKERTGSDRFGLFWRTPFMGDTLWRVIDNAYLYSYDCELACLPEGTPCNDGNELTKNDIYDASCNCEGTPCNGVEDCDETPLPDYTPTPACGIAEKIDNSIEYAWESCLPSVSPNPARDNSHWIQYDLGDVYTLNRTHIWNYNVLGNAGKGFRSVYVDYSQDGINWYQLGEVFSFPQAPGTTGYEGFSGPDFNGVPARYILITGIANWNDGPCSGLSKITIDAADCQLAGQSCNDENPNTINDKYDEDCICRGQEVEDVSCGTEILMQSNIVLEPGAYRASGKIISEGIIWSGRDVRFTAGESIRLLPGFHVQSGADFLARIDCPSFNLNQERVAGDRELSDAGKSMEADMSLWTDAGKTDLKIWPNPTSDWTTILFNLPDHRTVSLFIYTADGREITTLCRNQIYNKGGHTKQFPAHQLVPGMYYLAMKTEKEILTRPLVVIKRK